MSIPLRVLIVEDSGDDAALLLRELRHGGFEPTHERVETAEALRAALARQAWDVVISDHTMPGFNGLAAFKIVQDSGLDLPFIFVSGTTGEEAAVAAMKAGASDYILKSNLTRLVPAIGRELREAEHRREHERLEQQLRQAQKMEAVGRLAGGVAHDFNNLLTVISGYCQMLLEDSEASGPQHEYIAEIKDAGDRAAALARQLLAFSRQQVLQPRMLDLNAVIANTEKMLRRLIGEDIELVTAQGPGLELVKADPGQVEQIIMNLAVNARDAMPKGGKLTIETANVDLDEAYTRSRVPSKPGAYVMLAVTDTGTGMDSQTQARIFEPFFTTKEQGKGTGLGLSTVYGIVKQSGGYIWVYSEPGRGTTFKVYLPRSEEKVVEEVEERCKTRAKRPAGAETILLLEDEDRVRKLAQRILEAGGYRVLIASRGEEAERMSKEHQGAIHLLLTDVVMPQMSGREVANQLSPLRGEMRVLYMSGYTDDAVVRQGMLEPGMAFLQKPFTPETLLSKVREVLDS